MVAACDAEHRALDPAATYRVTVNDFLAAGGDEFYALRVGRNEVTGPLDVEALAQYLAAQVAPVEPHTDGRIALAGAAGASQCRGP